MASLTDALVKQLLAGRYIASLAAFDDVTIPITPESVIARDIREIDRQFFGGAIQANPAYRATSGALKCADRRARCADEKWGVRLRSLDLGPRICTVELKSLEPGGDNRRRRTGHPT
jgi:hypothetical protein